MEKEHTQEEIMRTIEELYEMSGATEKGLSFKAFANLLIIWKLDQDLKLRASKKL